MTPAPASLPLPTHVIGESRLTPGGRTASCGVDGGDGPPLAERTKGPADRVEILQNDAVLNHSVRFTHLVDLAGRLQIDGAGIDALVDLQECHAHPFKVAIDQCPETPVGVAIFGTDPRMQHERASLRDVEHFGL